MKTALLTLLILLLFYYSKSNTNEQLWWEYRDSALEETNGTKSLKYSTKALEIATELDMNNLIASSYIEIAHDYSKLGNYNLALENAFNAFEFYNNTNDDLIDKIELGIALDLIGKVYAKLENYKKSNEYYIRAIALIDNNTNPYIIGAFYTNLGENFRLTQQYDSALYYFQKVDFLYKKEEGYERKKGLSNCNLGLAYLGLNNIEKADSLLQLAFDYYLPNKKYYVVCICYYELAKKELERNNITKAKSYVSDMLAMALESNLTDQLRDGHLLMHKITTLEKDYKSANQHLIQHYTFKDSLINNKVVSQMAEQRAEFEIDRKQDEVDYFQAISKARTTVALLLSIGLLSIIALAAFLFIANRKRKTANIELEGKNTIIHQQLEEKDMLMREIHHRVKNNLQIISSIINLQNMRITDKKTQGIFSEMQRRITAIAAIHQKLYQGESLLQIHMKEYLGEVVTAIHTAFNTTSLNVNYEISIQNVILDVDAAVSIGLIVNELTTNAYKYAFKAEGDNLFVVSLISADKGCYLKVYDNGNGIPEGVDILQSDSLGLRMINLLARQMKGTLNYQTKNGAIFEIFFEGMKAIATPQKN